MRPMRERPRRPRRPSRRVARAAAAVAVAVLGLVGAAGPRVSAEDAPGSSACVVPVFVDDDATLRAAYDGLRLGLEEASLPRACRRAPPTADEGGWATVAREVVAEGAPFVVAMGPVSCARVAAAPFAGPAGRLPCVYVDVALSAGRVVAPEPPRVPLPCAVVRAEVGFERVGRVLRDLLPGRPVPAVRFPWVAPSPVAVTLRAGLEAAAGVRLVDDPSVPPDVVLDAPGGGEGSEPFSASLARATSLRVPVVSLDRGRFGQGAAVVVVPDAPLLGRVAAEAARRLVGGEGRDEPLRLSTRATETWVDLEAAAAEGLDPPVPFLARADRLRRARPVPTEAGR